MRQGRWRRRVIRSSSRSAAMAAPASPATSPPTPCRLRGRASFSAGPRRRGPTRSLPRSTARTVPHLPAADPASHSLLLERGLFRIPVRWPPVDAGGRAITPDFTLEVVRDPTGCNTHPVYGIDGRAARGVGLPAAAARGEPAVCGLVSLRNLALHREDGHARGPRSRHGPPGQHEHDGRCTRVDAEDAGAVGGARASRGRGAAVATAAGAGSGRSSCSSMRRRPSRSVPVR